MKKFLLLLLLAGCDGGGGFGNDSDKASIDLALSSANPTPPNAINCTAFLQWEAPTERMDGTVLPLSELAKFTIFVSENPDPTKMAISLIVEVSDSNLESWEIRDLSIRQHWFWLTVTDTEDRESGPSNVLGKNCRTG